MDTKSVQDKLQKAYHSMLEHIEELVDKDKKPLKQAFAEAEEKLSEWRELSREEVSHISDELKSNLSDMGEVSHQLNQSLKETLSFDANYLAGSVWKRLSKVADKTVLELSELGESLQRQSVTDASNYSEQQQVWLKDIEQWQDDYDKAIKKLDQVKAEVRKQIRLNKAQSKAIVKQQSDQQQHDLLSQKSLQATLAIDELFQQFFGEKS